MSIEAKTKEIVSGILAGAEVKRARTSETILNDFMEYLDAHDVRAGEDEADWLIRIGVMVPTGDGRYRVAEQFIGGMSLMTRAHPELFGRFAAKRVRH